MNPSPPSQDPGPPTGDAFPTLPLSAAPLSSDRTLPTCLQSLLREAHDMDRARLFAALRVDQQRRWQHGETIRVEDYLEECPSLREDAEGLLDLIYSERVLREEVGEPTTDQDYFDRFPDLRSKLERQFALHRLLDEEQLSRRSAFDKMGPDTVGPVEVSPKDTHKAKPKVRRLPVVSGYELLEELGRGGMGVVYKARQLGLKRLVALKMLRSGSTAGSDEMDRFRAEAAAVARLQHPQIVQVFEIGEQDGRPYYSMEYVDGGSLASQLRGTPLPPIHAAQLLEALALAIQAAHEAGVIHRDLKPANILINSRVTAQGFRMPGSGQTTYARPGQAGDSRSSGVGTAAPLLSPLALRITDFGLAKQLDEAGKTESGAVMGTPSYMAPEQAAGKKEAVGPHSDVYSLGAILYELLTGRPPFRGATWVDTLEQVRSTEPISPRRLQPKLARDIETICLKCLRKDPRHRYASADGLAADLRRFLNHEPIHARPVSRTERVIRWAKRRPVIAGLSAAILVLVMTMTVGSLFAVLHIEKLRRQEEAAKLNAQRIAGEYKTSLEERTQLAAKEELARRKAEAARLEKQKTLEIVETVLRSADPLGLELGGISSYSPTGERSKVTVSEVLDRAVPRLLKEHQNQPLLLASVLDTIGSVYRGMAEYRKAEPLLLQALELRRQHQADCEALGESLKNIGWLRMDQGDYEQAESHFRDALLQVEMVGDELAVAAVKFHLAWAMSANGGEVEADKMIREVLAVRARRLGKHRDVAITHGMMAGILMERGQLLEAAKHTSLGIQLMRELEPGNLAAEAGAKFQEGVIWKETVPVLAEPALRESLELAERAIGKDHPWLGIILHEYAQTLERLKKPEEAEKHYRRCLDVVRNTVGMEHPKSIIGVNSFANLLRNTNRAPEAHALYAELIEANKRRYGEGHQHVADALTAYGFFLGRLNDPRREATLREARTIYEKKPHGRRRYYLLCMHDLALSSLAKGDAAEAEKLLTEILPQARERYGLKNPDYAAILSDLAEARLEQRKLNGVEQLLGESIQVFRTAGIRHASLAGALERLSRCFRLQGRPREAAEAALQQQRLRPRHAGTQYAVAASLAQCVHLVAPGESSPTSEQLLERRKYADQALDALQQAVKLGFRNLNALETDKAFDSIRERAEFQELVREVKGKRS